MKEQIPVGKHLPKEKMTRKQWNDWMKSGDWQDEEPEEEDNGKTDKR